MDDNYTTIVLSFLPNSSTWNTTEVDKTYDMIHRIMESLTETFGYGNFSILYEAGDEQGNFFIDIEHYWHPSDVREYTLLLYRHVVYSINNITSIHFPIR